MVEDSSKLWTFPYSLVEQVSPPAFERLDDVQRPTLVLVGENDLAAVRALGALLLEKIPQAQLVAIAGGGHLLNLTSPKDFRESVNQFIELPKD